MKPWKQHAGHLAWPTLAFACLLLLAALMVWAVTFAGRIHLGVACLAMCVIDYLWFTPLHEAAHGNIGGQSDRKALDEGVGWLAAAFFLSPFPAFRSLHLRHHGHVNQDGKDPDLWVAGPHLPATILRCLSIVPYYYAMLFGPMRRESISKLRTARHTGFGLGLIATLVGLLFWIGFGPQILALWIVPGWISIAALAFVFDYLPHRPHKDTGRWTNSRILLGGRLLTILTTGQNYHLIHHLYPRVPFYRYGTVFHAMRSDLERHGSSIVETHLSADREG